MGFFKTKIEYFTSIVYKNVPFSLIWSDLDGTLVYCNSATEIFGSRKEKQIGKKFNDLFLDFHEFLEEKNRALLKGDGGNPIENQ